jgi:hypothetical protein
MTFRFSSLRKEESGNKKILWERTRACNGSESEPGIALLQHEEQTAVSMYVSYMLMEIPGGKIN